MRRLIPLLVAIIAFVAFGLLWIITDERATKRVFDVYSTANTGDDGLSLASGYLARHTKVAMLTRPVGREPIEQNAVVFRIAEELPVFFDPELLDEKEIGPPRPKKRPLLSDAEDAFVRRGGRVVIAAQSGALDINVPAKNVARKVFPIWRRVNDFELPAWRTFDTLRPRMHALFVADGRAVVARERIGDGEVYVIAVPELFQNQHLAKHLELLAALAGVKRPVYFDEVIHGITSDDGALALLKEWNLGPMLLMLGIVSLLLFWRGGRRVGPAEDEHRETRSDAVDLVRSLGALYRGVTRDSEAISLYYDSLTRTVANTSGLRGEQLRKRVDDLTGGLVPPSKSGSIPNAVFKRMLAQINQAFERLQSRR